MGRTLANDPLMGFRFKVEIDGIADMGFTEVSGLNASTEVIEYREGGHTYTRKLPGRQKIGQVTMSTGSVGSLTLYNWYNSVLTAADFRKNVTVVEQDREGNAVRQWVLHEAWASQFDAPALNAESSNVSIEKIVLEVEWLEAKKA
jgi:phage tail-like protein